MTKFLVAAEGYGAAFSFVKAYEMDRYKEIDKQISIRQQEIRGLQSLHVETPSGLPESTPKVPVRNLSDFGIVQTGRSGFTGVPSREIDTIDTSAETPTLDGQYGDRSDYRKAGKNVPISSPALTPILRDLPERKYEQSKPKLTNTHGTTKPRREIKLANYDGNSEWSDFKSHFDACADINAWDDTEKGLYLATALGGQAQVYLQICQYMKE